MDGDNEQQLRELVDAIPQPAWMARPDGSIQWFNRYWHELTATSPEEMAAWGRGDWARIQHPDHCDRVTNGYRHAIETGESWQDTFPLRDGNGAWRWFRTRAAPIRNATGQIEHWFGVNIDVTDQVEVAERLRESEARFRALVDASPLGIVIMDMHGQPIFFNPCCEALHGFGIDQARGEGWAHALHPEDRERIVRSWQIACDSSQCWAQVYRFVHPDGRTVWVSGRAAPMHVGGRQVGYVGALEDITELKLAECERERLLQKEQEARQEAQRATSVRDEVLGIVAHDLRQPLQTLVALTAQMVKAPSSQQHQTAEARLIRQTVDAMGRLIRDLLDVSTIESGGLVIVPAETDVCALLRDTLQSFGEPATAKGIELRSEPFERLPAVRGDPGRLMQVLSNVVGNAIKFTPAGGTVRLCARMQDECIAISVIDSGPGIAADNLAHIFDRFWQARRTDRSGAGLGLAIARGIVEAHGGRIWAESEPGKGTTLSFSVPLHSGEQESPAR